MRVLLPAGDRVPPGILRAVTKARKFRAAALMATPPSPA
jgi:hypothetical protein